MKKLFVLLVVSLTVSCAATIPLAEHNREVSTLNAQWKTQVEEVKCPAPTQEELDYIAKANVAAPELEVYMEYVVKGLANAMTMQYGMVVRVEIDEYSFVDDFNAAISTITITDPGNIVSGYAVFHRGPEGWHFETIVYTDREILKGAMPPISEEEYMENEQEL